MRVLMFQDEYVVNKLLAGEVYAVKCFGFVALVREYVNFNSFLGTWSSFIGFFGFDEKCMLELDIPDDELFEFTDSLNTPVDRDKILSYKNHIIARVKYVKPEWLLAYYTWVPDIDLEYDEQKSIKSHVVAKNRDILFDGELVYKNGTFYNEKGDILKYCVR